MPKIDLTNEKTQLSFGKDNIVIKKHIMGIEGGRSLNVDGFEPTVINGGHVIIKLANGDYAPMPIVDEVGEGDVKTGKKVYGTLPVGAAYVGVLKTSILTKKAFAAITTWGIVNEAALPYAIEGIKDAFLKAVPHIQFTKDEIA